jgi:D-alanyl-D-alanine carboxypeptidase
VTIRQTPLGPAYGHRGWTPDYLSIFAYYPDHEIAVALQINETADHDMSRYAARLAQAVIAARE